MGDWAELVPDLLTLIAKRVHEYEDFVAFGRVCRPWKSVAVKENFNISKQIPWLLLEEEEEEEEEEGSNLLGFVRLTKDGAMVRRAKLPKPRGRCCIISSMGWLITDNEAGEMELLHPLTQVRTPLPRSDGGNNLRRAVLSASPSVTDNYVLMITCNLHRYVKFWKPGNKTWNVIQPQQLSNCRDVIYYKDQFYLINRKGELLVCSNLDLDLDLDDNNSSATLEMVRKLPSAIDGSFAYLVECGGELLVVAMNPSFVINYDHSYGTKISFRVFKLDPTNLEKSQKMNNLGGRSIFVCDSGATAVDAAAAGIKPNCIYYAGEFVDRYATIYPSGRDKWQIQARLYNGYKYPPVWVFPSF